LEGLSPEWIQIGELIQNSNKSIREIARDHSFSDTAVRKMMKKYGWTRPDAPKARREPEREPFCEPVRTRPQSNPEDLAKYLETATVKELTGLGRNIINDLLVELTFLNRNHQTLEELVECYVNGERDDRTRARLIKALDHETRSKTMSALATALAKLNDAAPGKKEERQENAEQAASTGRFAAPSAPKFTH
jgi:hypothetical protein